MMKLTGFLAGIFALGTAACATQPAPAYPPVTMQMQTVNFEHFDATETLLFVRSAEERYGWTTTDITGSSGYMSLGVYTPPGGASVYSGIAQIMQGNGYNLDKIKITASPDGTITVDRIVDDGYRPV